LDFPPEPKSICDPDAEFPFNSPVVWKRPKEWLGGPDMIGAQGPVAQIFLSTVEPGDILPGQLNDAWFLSALAVMAEHPGLIKRLFLSNFYSEEGIYKIKICKGGIWHTVTIDDYFPCSLEGGPFFSRNMIGNELWVLLLEKAYAKLHGNYFTLRGGYASEAFTDLTGCPTECWYFDDEIS